MGNKVLRQRLKGPALAAYYPRKMSTLKDLRKAYSGPDDFEIPNDEHEDWEENHKMYAPYRPCFGCFAAANGFVV